MCLNTLDIIQKKILISTNIKGNIDLYVIYSYCVIQLFLFIYIYKSSKCDYSTIHEYKR